MRTSPVSATAAMPAKLTETPVSAPLVNLRSHSGQPEKALAPAERVSQVPTEQPLAAHLSPAGQAESASLHPRASCQATPEAVNLADDPADDDLQANLERAARRINLETGALAKTRAFDDFNRGRLVSLLALGLSLRQSAAALGISHTAVWKELKRNPDLNEQITSARYQAQVEPLLMIMKEARRSWRAAAWLVRYLDSKVQQRDETPDEAHARFRAEIEDEVQRSQRRTPPRPLPNSPGGSSEPRR